MMRLLGISLMALFLQSCVSTRSVEDASREPAQVEDRVVINGEVLPLPEERDISATSLPNQPSSSAVVKRLVASAERHQDAGDADTALSSLERALRIEPRNAMLWSRMADIRVGQGDHKQAIQLAAKSNTLAGANMQLRRQNWYLMANAHKALGNFDAAEKFRVKLLER